jgi:hypothetical protein
MTIDGLRYIAKNEMELLKSDDASLRHQHRAKGKTFTYMKSECMILKDVLFKFFSFHYHSCQWFSNTDTILQYSELEYSNKLKLFIIFI